MDAAELRIRRALASDVEDVRRIHNEAIAEGPFAAEDEPKTREDREAWFAAHGDRHPVWVAERAGAVVGWACVTPWSTYASHRGAVEISVYVARAARGGGLGRRLVAHVVEATRALGYRSLIARVASNNAQSLRLHEGLGFRAVGTMRDVSVVRGELFDEVVLELLVGRLPAPT